MWIFRWLQRLLAAPRTSSNAKDPHWVEPSNAITRAILAGIVDELPDLTRVPAPGEAAPAAAAVASPAAAAVASPAAMPAPAAERVPSAQPVTRTAQRSRRRRASRAA